VTTVAPAASVKCPAASVVAPPETLIPARAWLPLVATKVPTNVDDGVASGAGDGWVGVEAGLEHAHTTVAASAISLLSTTTTGFGRSGPAR